MRSDLSGFKQKLSHAFKSEKYIRTALTHSSYANEAKLSENNERQEFLGDAVLSIVVSDYLFKRYHMAEGDLTRIRASLVCERSLCAFAGELDLGEALLLGKGEEQTGGRTRPSILADAFEALIAAVYLDGGLDAAKAFIIPFVERALDSEQAEFNDYKTALQEIAQKNPGEQVSYRLVDEQGPDHDKCFVVEVLLNSNVIGKGEGRSKKAAEQSAAKQALALMGQ
ncbi:MAG: ribonuclease III [Oscillospiraceae bacterium]|nr:ribonuclease III [Oscillospiraceae bacterium]